MQKKKKNEEHLTFREILLPSSKIKEQKIPTHEKRSFIFVKGKDSQKDKPVLFCVNKFIKNCLNGLKLFSIYKYIFIYICS